MQLCGLTAKVATRRVLGVQSSLEAEVLAAPDGYFDSLILAAYCTFSRKELPPAPSLGTPPHYTVKAGCKDSFITLFLAAAPASMAPSLVRSIPASSWEVSRITLQRQPVEALVTSTLQERSFWRGTLLTILRHTLMRFFIGLL